MSAKFKKVDFTLNSNVQFIYDRDHHNLIIKTDNGKNLEVFLGESNTATVIINDDGNLEVDQIQNIAHVNFAPELHHIHRIYGDTDHQRIILTNDLIELTQGGEVYTKDISMVDDKIEFSLEGAGKDWTFQLNENGLSISNPQGTYKVLDASDTYSEFDPSSNQVATMLDVGGSATPHIGSTTASFTTPSSGTDNLFDISSITMEVGNLEVGATIYALNGWGIVVRLTDTQATVRFVSSYQANLGPLAVARSISLSSDLVTGQLTVELTDVDGNTYSSITPIGGGGQYMHTFDLESHTDDYNISATYITFAPTNTQFFHDSTGFLAYLGASSSLSGIWGTATALQPADYDVDMSSIQNFNSYEIDHVLFSTDFIPSFTSGDAYVHLTNGLEFGFEQSSASVYVSPPYTEEKFTIGNVSGFAPSFTDKSFEGDYDTRRLNFPDLNSVAMVIGTFKYTGKFTAELINPYKDGVPTEIAGNSGSNRGLGTIVPNDSDYEPLVYGTSSLSPCLDGVSSTPVPGIGNYDTLTNKPYNYTHQALEKYIDGIKKTANNANTKAKSALGLATTAEAGVLQLESIVYSPVPLGPVGPHKGLFGLIPEMEADMLRLNNDIGSVNGEVARLRDDIDALGKREGTINVTNVGADAAGVGYGITLTDNPLGTGPKHYYRIQMNNAGAGVTGGPEYCIRPNPNPTTPGMRDETPLFSFDRFNGLRQTILTMNYRPDQLDIDQYGLRLANNIVMDERLAILGNNMTVGGHRTQLTGQDEGFTIETARAGTRAAQFRLADDGLGIRGNNPNTAYVFDYDQGLLMGGKQISNVKDGTHPQDAVTLNQLQQVHGKDFDDYRGFRIISPIQMNVLVTGNHVDDLWAITSQDPNTFIVGEYDAAANRTLYRIVSQGADQCYLVNSKTPPLTILNTVKTISWGNYTYLRNIPIGHDSAISDTGAINDTPVIQATNAEVTILANSNPSLNITENDVNVGTKMNMRGNEINNLAMNANPQPADATTVEYVQDAKTDITNGGLNGWKIMVVNAMPPAPAADVIYFVKGT